MKRIGKSLIIAFFVTALASFSAFAGSWEKTELGYRYLDDNGAYLADTWRWIDGNNDGIAECYCFNVNGYMYADTVTPDGNQVNAEGAWVIDGVIQTQVLTATSQTQNAGLTATGFSGIEGGSGSVTKNSGISSQNDNSGGSSSKTSNSGSKANTGSKSGSSYQTSQQNKNTELTVYLPVTGEKYHSKPNCGRMNASKARAVSVSDAIAKGYEACKKCF